MLDIKSILGGYNSPLVLPRKRGRLCRRGCFQCLNKRYIIIVNNKEAGIYYKDTKRRGKTYGATVEGCDAVVGVCDGWAHELVSVCCAAVSQLAFRGVHAGYACGVYNAVVTGRVAPKARMDPECSVVKTK